MFETQRYLVYNYLDRKAKKVEKLEPVTVSGWGKKVIAISK